MAGDGASVLDVTCVVEAGNYLGETPFWSAAEQALYWINCEKPAEIHRWSPSSDQHSVWPMPKRVGGFVFKATGGLLVVLADGLYDFDPATGHLALRASTELPEHVSLHECQTDRQGRLWVGSFDHHYPADRSTADGFLFQFNGKSLEAVIDKVTISNGLACSPDGTVLYAVNTRDNAVDAFDLDPVNGALSNPRRFFSVPREVGFCDGAAVDCEGGYWSAIVGSGTLRRYLPDGTLDRTIVLPFSNPTRPAFGGEDLGTLYVTSTQMAIKSDAPGYAANGGVFALRPGVAGMPETLFAG